jgi:segregation and condensation protein B
LLKAKNYWSSVAWRKNNSCRIPTQIDTSSEFFEQEKVRQRERRDSERAANIREAMAVGEVVESKDKKWLARYEAKLASEAAAQAHAEAGAPMPDAAAAAAEDGDEAEGEDFRKDIEGLSENFGMDAADADEKELSEKDVDDDPDALSDAISADEFSGDTQDDFNEGDFNKGDFNKGGADA